MKDSFKTKTTLAAGGKTYTIFSLAKLEQSGFKNLGRLPFSIRILLENLLRKEDGVSVKPEDIQALAEWNSNKPSEKEISFTPARVLLQDFTGVPVVVDLAAMRDWVAKKGGDPRQVNPLEPVDLVIDHSIQVDVFGSFDAFKQNAAKEFERNRERYQFLRWGQRAFQNFRAVPPNTGIVHQVNLEYLAQVVCVKDVGARLPRPSLEGGETPPLQLYPDTLVGTDSHTTMINGLGVLGWGVGGIEAEAAMVGQPISMLIPEVVGFKLSSALREGVTATDLVLTITQMLRKKGVVGKFVEFFGSGLDQLSLPDRATVANMAPEYGATVGFFPVDEETLRYLRLTGRSEEQITLVETYLKFQGLFRTSETHKPVFSDTLELDLNTVEPSLAGPRRPQDRVPLKEVRHSFEEALSEMVKASAPKPDPGRLNHWENEGANPKSLAGNVGARLLSPVEPTGEETSPLQLNHGSVVIAAITSCTNTSNPAVMVGAGLLAKKAVERGLTVKPWVKTSLAPGSKVVMDYLEKTGLKKYLEELKFYLVGFGCTTCIGNSGPLPAEIGSAIKQNDLVAVAVLSGNRNFEGRINPLVRASYLASPPLVVAYALSGTVGIDLTKEPVGQDKGGKPVYLKDIWPRDEEVKQALAQVEAGMFQKQYADVLTGDENWKAIQIPVGDTFRWDEKSTYIKNPPYFDQMPDVPAPLQDIENARVLIAVGDSVTTDHISPAGSIAQDSPAGKYLIANGVRPEDFNSYGARRGNHEVMMRGTFANIRIRNLLVPGIEGGVTKYIPTGEQMPIYDAAMKYKAENVPLIVIAGKEYGSGSSRDWAAKGPALLGVRAVIAESFERIHRSNLIGMGVLPLEFKPGENQKSLGLTGEETYSIEGIRESLAPRKILTVCVRSHSGEKKFSVICRIDTPVELAYYRHGGILPYVLRQLRSKKA